MRGTKRGTSKGGAAGRVRAIRRTKSAQVWTVWEWTSVLCVTACFVIS